MKKIQYIAPAIEVIKLDVENMIAESGPEVSSASADVQYGMDVKGYNGKAGSVDWDDDWSE